MERTASDNRTVLYFSSLFLLTGLFLIFLFPPQGRAGDLEISPQADTQRFFIHSDFFDRLTNEEEVIPTNNNLKLNSYVIHLKYEIKKDFFFLVGRKIKYSVDPGLYAPPGSYEFNPGLTLNRPPTLGQVGFSLRY